MKVVVKLTEAETKGLKETVTATELFDTEDIDEVFDKEYMDCNNISSFSKTKTDGEFSDVIEVYINEKATEIVLNATIKIAKFIKPIVDIVNLAIKQFDDLMSTVKSSLDDLNNSEK